MQLAPEDQQKLLSHLSKYVKGCPICGGKLGMTGVVQELRPFTGGGMNVSVGGPIDPNLLLVASAICEQCSGVQLFKVSTS